MPPFLHRATHSAALLSAVLVTAQAAPAHGQELPAPHLIHAYEGWVALAVVVSALAGAIFLITRALRR